MTFAHSCGARGRADGAANSGRSSCLGWRDFPLSSGLLRPVDGAVGAVVDMRRDATLRDLPDHQNPWEVLACRPGGVVEDPVFMLSADRTVAFERVGRVLVHCFPLQHGYP